MSTFYLKDVKPGVVYKTSFKQPFLVLRNDKEAAGSADYFGRNRLFSYLWLTGIDRGNVVNMRYRGNAVWTLKEFEEAAGEQ